ncbi:hypothetical protein M0R72_15620 [Candidatus Pacearchaeota archaeon]|jgi:hypothetical protein|nr:hypothetical protein [Candidatus Pacearchaeota archaeon]
MSNLISGSVKVIAKSDFDNVLDLTAPRDSLSKIINKAFTDGTGANKAQVHWTDQRILLTTAGETLDLEALAGAFGVVTFDKIKFLIIEVTTLTTGYRLEVGAADANQWAGANQLLKDVSDILRVEAGGVLLWIAPVDGGVVDGTHSDLKIYNPSGGSVTYNIIAIGEGTVA